MLEETFTDKEFCEKWKIDRATSLRWREQGIVGYVKLPNGQIRYLQSQIDELKKRCGIPSTLQDVDCTIKSGVVNISVAKRRHDARMS